LNSGITPTPSANILISSTGEPEPFVGLMMPTMARQQS
jgi:hypothetical protein